MAKTKTKFICNNCGYETVKWLGKCPMCGEFDTFNEEIIQEEKIAVATKAVGRVESINNITFSKEKRLKVNIGELDRVLSGGIVEGSLTLVGGDPGIGKSTLLLQICQNIGIQDKKVLYISGEESKEQIKLRAERLNVNTDNLFLLCETNMDIALNTIKETMPQLVIIDSIQTMYLEGLTSAPGSVTQVRECTSKLMYIAKGMGISVFVVGHVTKSGAIAGPKVLEHMVDTVLYFEGEKKDSYRVLRVVKNRFGSTDEIGVFEMVTEGLREIKNPSEFMLSGRPLGASGSVITCSVEGSRPILSEIQSLVSYTNFGIPRRMAMGLDYNRMNLLIAVLEKRADFQLGNYDCYINVAGGVKIFEPSLDAAVICAIASSYKNKAIDPHLMVFGEVGLTGEIRAVNMAQKRISEAEKLGFKTCIMPKDNLKNINSTMTVYGVGSINELIEISI